MKATDSVEDKNGKYSKLSEENFANCKFSFKIFDIKLIITFQNSLFD